MTESIGTRWLKCKLSESELLERGRTMSERCAELDSVQAEKAQIVREFGGKLKKIGGEVTRLSETVRTGEEERPVKCATRIDQLKDLYTVTRLDTNEVIESRELRDYEKEKQPELFERNSDEEAPVERVQAPHPEVVDSDFAEVEDEN